MIYCQILSAPVRLLFFFHVGSRGQQRQEMHAFALSHICCCHSDPAPVPAEHQDVFVLTALDAN